MSIKNIECTKQLKSMIPLVLRTSPLVKGGNNGDRGILLVPLNKGDQGGYFYFDIEKTV